MKVRVFFNDAIGGAFAPGVNRESDERRDQSRLRDSLPYNPYCDGYDAERAVLVESRLSPLVYDVRTSDLAVCERVFCDMNADDRANGQFERSLSVGDVVEVEGRRYSCENVGWKEIV